MARRRACAARAARRSPACRCRPDRRSRPGSPGSPEWSRSWPPAYRPARRRASPRATVIFLPDQEADSMDFALTESQELIKKEVGALARTFPLDYWLDKDDRAEYPSEFVKAFADNGWLGITIPEAYGGGRARRTRDPRRLHEDRRAGGGAPRAPPHAAS